MRGVKSKPVLGGQFYTVGDIGVVWVTGMDADMPVLGCLLHFYA